MLVLTVLLNRSPTKRGNTSDAHPTWHDLRLLVPCIYGYGQGSFTEVFVSRE
jgi:hypothetical protein